MIAVRTGYPRRSVLDGFLRCNRVRPASLLMLFLSCQTLWAAESKEQANELIKACYSGELKNVQRLIDDGADVNAVDKIATSALMAAVQGDRASVADYLLKKKADPNTRDKAGWTALHYACQRGSLQTTRLLLEHGADPNARLRLSGPDGSASESIELTPVLLASCYADLATVSELVAHGGELDGKIPWKDRPHTAIGVLRQRGKVSDSLADDDIRSLLKREGVVPVANDLVRVSALGSSDEVKMFATSAENVNATNDGGSTPLCMACLHSRYDIVKVLLAAKADPNRRDRRKNLPLVIACKSKEYGIAVLLLEHGADPKLRDASGKSALEFTKSAKIVPSDSTPAELQKWLRASLIREIWASLKKTSEHRKAYRKEMRERQLAAEASGMVAASSLGYVPSAIVLDGNGNPSLRTYDTTWAGAQQMAIETGQYPNWVPTPWERDAISNLAFNSNRLSPPPALRSAQTEADRAIALASQIFSDGDPRHRRVLNTAYRLSGRKKQLSEVDAPPKENSKQRSDDFDTDFRIIMHRSELIAVLAHKIAQETNGDLGLALERERDLYGGFLGVNAVDAEGWTPLHYACARNMYDAARLLLESGASVNTHATGRGDLAGVTPLHCACLHPRQSRLVGLLIRHGALVNAKDAMGREPLWFAALHDPELVGLLLDNGATINYQDFVAAATPLMVATTEGKLDIVKTLLDRGAGVEYWSKNGESVFDLARRFKQRTVLEYLQSRVQEPDSIPPAYRRFQTWRMQDIADPENLDGPVTNIQFSPDGSLLAASDGNIRIWEAASGKRRCAISARNMADPTQLPSHPYFGSMQFSADGNRLIASAAGRNNRAICSTWKIPEGVRVASKFVDGMRYCGQISVNGQMLSTSDLNQNYFVRCLADGSVLRAFKLPWNGATASDPRLQYVAVTRGGREYRKVPRKEYITEVFSPELQIVEQSTGEVKHILETKLEKEREDLIRVMQFSPKGDTLATGCLSGLLSLWNVRYGGHLRNLGQQLQDPVSDVAFTPDGKVIASASDKNGNISLWNADNGILLTVLQSDSKGIQALGFSPDGKRLASGGIDGAVRIWSDSCDRTVIPTAAIREVKADGRSLLLQLSAVTPTNVKLSYQYRTNSITDWQTTPDGKVELPYKLGTSLWIEARSVAPNGNLSPVVRSVRSFRPDRDEIILKERWDRTPGHIHSIDFGPDGRSLAAGDWQGNVYVWNLAEKDSAYLLEQRKSSICGVAFRDHGKSLVALDASGNICQWNAANWTPQPSHKSPHKPEDSVLSPDGRYVADLRKSDDSAKISIRQTTDGGIVATLDEIVGFSFKMAFSYDGKILAVSMNTPEPQAPTTSAKWKKAPLPSGKWEVISFGVPDGKKRGVITTDDRLSNGVAFEWNAKAIVVGRRLLEYPGGKTICHIGSIGNCPASVCPGAEMVAGTESDYITQAALLKIYRTADRQTVFATRLEKMPTTTVFSPDGNMLAVGMQDGVIRVLRLRCQWESKSSVR